ncbi:dienelactone hydrolase family protein [Bacillus sp. PS06]|uniref:dienelactone hydrolase family protein n=1 Tax=Bacillus sp. PS06 TaxID=2764176 RepID=UPI001786F729|nr:alpha/beta hydrolase family protein [Bacillus sp. PS06]MBD8071147.1 dienelactone hydrolase family protein [Bacillus sp. PS06]
MLQTDQFFEKMYADTFPEHKQHVKEHLESVIGTFHKPEAFNPVFLEKKEFDEYTREKILIQSTGGLEIPLYVLTPKLNQYAYPAVLSLHGHGYGVKEIVGLTAEGLEDEGDPGIHQHFAVKLVKKGLKVFAPEVIGMGERRLEQDQRQGKNHSCYTMSTHLLMAGKTLAGLRVFEARHLIDYISQQEDVEQGKIGIMGFSGGGLIAAYTSALDERIHSTVLCGFTNTFKGSILASDHCLCNYIPGLLNVAELPDIIGLIAPRKLFVESGKRDPIFPVDHVKQAISVLEETYGETNTPEDFAYDLFEGAHEISGRRSYDWLVRSLQHDTART